MWRLWHRLFGWDYVRFTYGHSWRVGRLQRDGDGRPYVFWSDQHLDLASGVVPWFPLTCPRTAIVPLVVVKVAIGASDSASDAVTIKDVAGIEYTPATGCAPPLPNITRGRR